MSQKVAIVTTVKNPGPPLDSFVKYHLAAGFEHIFIFFDDPDDAWFSSVENHKQVTAIKTDSNLRARWARSRLFNEFEPYIETQIMPRQQLNVEIAIDMALDMGFDWLLHIDVDELFYCEQVNFETHFQWMASNNVFLCTYLNHEAVPGAIEIENYFRKVTLFKKNPALIKDIEPQLISQWPEGRQYFNAYSNGKSVVKLSRGVQPNGVHEFRPADNGKALRMYSNNPVILHYPNCGLDFFINKYRIRGSFPDNWFGNLSIAEHIGAFHLRCRDTLSEDNRLQASALYQQEIMINDRELEEKLLTLGALCHITSPADFLNGKSETPFE